jgi:hypothetical protein
MESGRLGATCMSALELTRTEGSAPGTSGHWVQRPCGTHTVGPASAIVGSFAYCQMTPFFSASLVVGLVNRPVKTVDWAGSGPRGATAPVDPPTFRTGVIRGPTDSPRVPRWSRWVQASWRPLVPASSIDAGRTSSRKGRAPRWRNNLAECQVWPRCGPGMLWMDRLGR